MITYNTVRRQGSNDPGYNYGDNTVTVEEALYYMLKFELGYGGKLASMDRTDIIIRTSVFGTVDTVHFRGSEEDMLPLIQAIGLWDHFSKTDNSLDKTMEMLQHFGSKGMTALTISHIAPLLIGGNRLRAIFQCALAVETSTELATRLEKETFETTVAAFSLLREGVTCEEVLQALQVL